MDSKKWLEPAIRGVVHVAVAPQHQRRGAGRLLTEDALDDDTVTSVVLSCHPDAHAAQSLHWLMARRACQAEIGGDAAAFPPRW